jgi:hypothetical protein
VAGADGQQRDFFISYTSTDRAWAEWVAWQLEDEGWTTVLQAWDFSPGDNFIQRMRDALEQADRTIALLSPAYLASPYGTDEWTGASCTTRTARSDYCRCVSRHVRCPGCWPPGCTSTWSGWAALPTSVWTRMYAVTTSNNLLVSCRVVGRPLDC